MVRSRTFGHFCVLATAMERLGDRWTLLVVRDLLAGPRRFTDLSERLAGITPKTLTQRLRDLERHGLVVVDRVNGRREVWYSLTTAGQDLEPVLDELMLWGLHHAAQPWEPGEPVHPEHLLWALRVMLEREGIRIGPVTWLLRLADGDAYVIRHGPDGWTVAPGIVPQPDVTITTTREGWARLLTTPPADRLIEDRDLQLTGPRRAIRQFVRALEVFPHGPSEALS